MKHVVLLGDSIFDNAAYVPGELPVIAQLQALLPEGWQATLLAVDGDVTADVKAQYAKLPETTTAIVISCGGNDALRHWDVLAAPTATVGEALSRLADIRAAFRQEYRQMLALVTSEKRQVQVCTIYDAIPGLSPAAQTALALFNEVILKEAITFQVPIIDLRVICTEAMDYSSLSPIEPSARGGEKIAKAIAQSLIGDAIISTVILGFHTSNTSINTSA